eukprot:CAMPEP_0175080130 /NCGR_PEP_ID=MMETSP0052_2-20121109/25302_1 /TAXON_ID=51329 ORGANISM="Polytomella parva, Strain SAG 63-3" /NCGR_SAMPLE_ID=MMETSP0052_2 /ASSEMBLY_ACC=CAM_ASM_000194 /LENGTH=422 /DNA_ID=CAMNT_0016350727 /DNA_START=377 /DNA_END=1645 /DNA_ORIENTATION=+
MDAKVVEDIYLNCSRNLEVAIQKLGDLRLTRQEEAAAEAAAAVTVLSSDSIDTRHVNTPYSVDAVALVTPSGHSDPTSDIPNRFRSLNNSSNRNISINGILGDAIAPADLVTPLTSFPGNGTPENDPDLSHSQTPRLSPFPVPSDLASPPPYPLCASSSASPPPSIDGTKASASLPLYSAPTLSQSPSPPPSLTPPIRSAEAWVDLVITEVVSASSVDVARSQVQSILGQLEQQLVLAAERKWERDVAEKENGNASRGGEGEGHEGGSEIGRGEEGQGAETSSSHYHHSNNYNNKNPDYESNKDVFIDNNQSASTSNTSNPRPLGEKSLGPENSLQRKVADLIKENMFLKKAIQIQHRQSNEIRGEKMALDEELRVMREQMEWGKSRICQLETMNYSLAIHLDHATKGGISFASDFRNPDVF